MSVDKISFEITSFWGQEPRLEVPEEITLLILSFLSVRDISCCQAVNRCWKQLASDESLWKKLCSDEGMKPTGQATAYNALKDHILRPSYRQYHLSRSPLPPTATLSTAQFGEQYSISRMRGNYLIFWRGRFVRITNIRKPDDDFSFEWERTNNEHCYVTVRIGESHLVLGVGNQCKVVDLEKKSVVKTRETDREIEKLDHRDDAIYIFMLNKIEKWDWKEDEIITIYENKSDLDSFPGQLVQISKEILFVQNRSGLHTKIFDLKDLSEIPNPNNKLFLRGQWSLILST